MERESYTKEEIGHLISARLQKYTAHIYTIYTQNEALKADKHSLYKTSVIIQMNFAKNYGIKHQNEFMTFH